MHDATCIDLEVVTYVHGGEGLARKVGVLITEIIVTCRYEASLLAVEVVADAKCHTTSITIFKKVGGLDAVAQEEVIHPFLLPLLHPIYCGWEN